MRALRLFLAFGLLALANLAGSGGALACERWTTVDAPSGSAQEMSNLSHAEPRLVIRAAAGTPSKVAPVGHRDPVPHQHDHGGADGCCVLCCGGVAAPYVLMQEPALFLARPGPGAIFIAYSTAVAKAAGGLPFRPPRAA